MTQRIAPSILAADFARLAEEVRDVLEGGADWIHVDVMDGVFVPNITMGPMVVEALRRQFDCHLDVHLMIERPERHIDAFADAGASSISVHHEATPNIHRALQQIRSHNISAGLALNPGTGLDCVEALAEDIDLLLIMTVNPGFGGQPFLTSTLPKIRKARAILDQLGRSDVPIEVDGGISPATIHQATAAGASICVAGSAIFAKPNRKEAIMTLRSAE